jgi:hypothetical protein
VNSAEVAVPVASVVAVFTPPANVPLAPVEGGGVKVTTTPAVAVPFVVTFTTNGFANAVFTVALCPDPLTTVIVGTGVAELVREKLAGVATPGAEAVTA